MVKITVLYQVGKDSKIDVLTCSKVSMQRDGHAMGLTFPNGDGQVVLQYTKKPTEPVEFISWISYAHCDRVLRSDIED